MLGKYDDFTFSHICTEKTKSFSILKLDVRRNKASLLIASCLCMISIDSMCAYKLPISYLLPKCLDTLSQLARPRKDSTI